jgi:hypothetical protein
VETDAATHFKLVFDQLKKLGFLLESDPKLPSVCRLITGTALKSSWWSHPLAQTIFNINEQLEDHADVLITKLVSGKVTFVHRKFWSEIFSIGSAREPWQIKGLSDSARLLLKMIDENGSLTTERLSWPRTSEVKPGDAARELEKRLLIHSDQFHTERGMHAKLLETWEHWAKRTRFQPPTIPTEKAKRNWEDRLLKLDQQFGASAKLPW